MFAEYLRRHPLASLLARSPDLRIPTAADRERWERISPGHSRELRELIGQYAGLPYPPRTATGFLAFVGSGSRKADEEPYFLRRRKLCAAALACCLSEEEAPDGVIDGLWCVCEETSWVISAHNVNPIPGAPAASDYPLPDPDRPYVDLFSAQTAMILSLVRHLLRDRLDRVSPMLCERIEREISRRVLRPFMETDDFWWMGVKRRDLNNWTPWILSSIMLSACLILANASALAALLDRACRMLDGWLDAVPDDGGCDEGAGYWNMAGGALLDCLQLLEDATEGRMTFWDEPKIRAILRFPLAAEIGNGWFVNFADCDARPFLSGERLQYAGEKLRDPALFALGCRCRGTLAAQLNDTPHFIRLLRMLFHDPRQQAADVPREDVWLPDLQVRVVRRNGLTLCCKGGHNGESHNHNDVGSFMLYADGLPGIVDAGNMTYTAKTFSAERYTLWNVRAAYHNLPVVGGHEQQPGREYAAEQAQCLPDGLSLELRGAYAPEAGIRSFRRTMTLTGNGCEILDQICLTRSQPVTWVFMLRNRPEITRDALTAGSIRMTLPEEMKRAVEEIPIKDERMSRSFPGSLWRITLSAGPRDMFDMKFTVRRNSTHA